MTTPFAYYLDDDFAGKRYLGVRYGEGCAPSDLFTSYFSSSGPVNALIDAAGAHVVFVPHLIRTFDTAAEALAWEQAVLTWLGAARSPLWYNKHDGGGAIFFVTPEMAAKTAAKLRGRERAPEAIAKHAAKMRGRKRPDVAERLRGKKSPEHAAKLRGRKRPDETARRRGKPTTQTNAACAKGVGWYAKYSKWRVRCMSGNGVRLVGYFKDFAEAVAAAKAAFDTQYGELSPYYGKTLDEAVAEALARREAA